MGLYLVASGDARHGGAIPGSRESHKAGCGHTWWQGFEQGREHIWWQGVLQGRDGVEPGGRASCRAGVGPGSIWVLLSSGCSTTSSPKSPRGAASSAAALPGADASVVFLVTATHVILCQADTASKAFLTSRLQVTLFGKEKKRKDYAFRRQFNEKPRIIPGCPGHTVWLSLLGCAQALHIWRQLQ